MKIHESVEMYINYRQSLGEKFKTNASVLRSFARHFGSDKELGSLSKEDCDRYLLHPQGKVTASWFCKHTALKGFFQWTVVREHIVRSPLTEELPKRPEHIRPYIYSDKELKALFNSALTFQKNRSHIYPECVREILVLTYVLGLRIHETMGLQIKDLDMKTNIVTIDDSKFYKTRIEPFNNTVKTELEIFLEWRKKHGMPSDEESHLFLDKRGKPMSLSSFNDIFRRVRNKAGIYRNDDAVYPPRIHDLRHTFAVNRLIAWYKAGEDVQKLLPVLSAYMGHTHISHTSVYLSMTNGLLGAAGKRFETFWEGQSYEQ